MQPTSSNPTMAVPYLLDDGEGEVIRWFGDTITVKAAGPELDVALLTVVAGSEPPAHVHDAVDEVVFVLDGELTIVAGGESFAAATGSFAFLPRGVPHAFAVASGKARLLLIGTPSGLLAMFSDAEEHFGARGMPARLDPAALAAVAATLARFGVTIVGDEPRPAPERKEQT